MNTTVTIGISTTCNRFYDNIKYLFEKSKEALEVADEVLIVIQKANNKKEYHNDFLNISTNLKIIYDDGIGLSRSRNQILYNSNSDYVWIIDDDVILERNSIKNLKNYIKKVRADIICGRVGCAENDSLFQKYPSKKKLGKLDLYRVSSVEIIIKKDFVINNDLSFDTHIGLGTSLPSGEETIFLLESYQANASIYHMDTIICFHPCIGRGISSSENKNHDWNNERYMVAKGNIARKSGYLLGSLLILRWSLRILNGPVSNKGILSLFKGFLTEQ